jgi:hypothetical protein
MHEQLFNDGQVPFPEQTFVNVELIPLHSVNSQLFPEYPVLQKHCPGSVQFPFLEHTSESEEFLP